MTSLKMKEKDFFHRIRNMLTVVKGNLDLIKFDNVSSSDRKFLKSAKDEVNQIKNLIESFENKENTDN